MTSFLTKMLDTKFVKFWLPEKKLFYCGYKPDLGVGEDTSEGIKN